VGGWAHLLLLLLAGVVRRRSRHDGLWRGRAGLVLCRMIGRLWLGEVGPADAVRRRIGAVNVSLQLRLRHGRGRVELRRARGRC
jgi:hypothetical protein